MTDQERDPEADGPEGAADPDAAANAAEADDDQFDSELDDELSEDEGLERAEDATPASTPASAATRPGGGRRVTRAPAGRQPIAPTIADEAVHVQDRVSAYFVIATVGVFVLILLWALLLGRNGPITDAFATPKPSRTPVVSVSPSVEPSASSSVAPSGSASAAPSGSASAAPSSSASAEPSGSPSAAPSAEPGSPSPSAS